MPIQAWLRSSFVLLFLCAAPAMVHARGFDCPSNGTLFTNMTGGTWTFLLTVETNVPLSVAWHSPQGPKSATVPVDGVLNIAVAAGTAVTYSCTAAGFADGRETTLSLAVGIDCFNALSGPLFQEMAGSATTVFLSVTNVYTLLTFTYSDSSGQTTWTVNPGSTRDLGKILAARSSLTYQCGAISLPPAVFAVEGKK